MVKSPSLQSHGGSGLVVVMNVTLHPMVGWDKVPTSACGRIQNFYYDTTAEMLNKGRKVRVWQPLCIRAIYLLRNMGGATKPPWQGLSIVKVGWSRDMKKLADWPIPGYC